MKILEKTTTPDGIKIQLENWSEHDTDKYNYGLIIGAYPVAMNSHESGYIVRGDYFRLSIDSSENLNYTNDDVKRDFEALKNGEKKLEDLKEHFHYGKRDMFLLGVKEKRCINEI